MECFKVYYASFDGGDNTAFIPMAVAKDDPNTFLCCFPEADSDEGKVSLMLRRIWERSRK